MLPVAKGEKLTVDDLLNEKLITVGEGDDLATAASSMIKNKISGIPVIDSKKNLIGVVSKTDVIRAFSIVGPHEDLKTKYKELY